MSRIWLALMLLLAIAVAGSDPALHGQQRKQKSKAAAAKKNPAKKPAPPKSNLPNAGRTPEVFMQIAAVDPYKLPQIKASAEKIDRLIETQLLIKGVQPNPLANDALFARRVHLDITGRIPKGRDVYSFLASKDPDKRSKLIDELLSGPGYASHFYNYWADVLRFVDKSAPNTYTRPFTEWFKQALRDNRPYDELVREMLVSEGKPWENPAVGYKLRDRGMPLDNLSNTVRIFLGTRIGCAQCHDHPFDHWRQKQFYELAAFEGGVRTTRPAKDFKLKSLSAAEKLLEGAPARRLRTIERYNREQVFENVSLKLRFPHDYGYDDAKPKSPVTPNVLFGDRPPLKSGHSRRTAYAEWLTSKDNPRFALTIANRLWKRNLGIGLIEPVDDLRDESEPANQELMDFLVQEMKRLDFNLKEFQRIIYHTQAYQRQVVYEDIDLNEPFDFRGPALRRMTAEQVWDSLMTLTLQEPDNLLRPDDKQFIAALDAEANASPQQLANKAKALIAAEQEQRKADRTQSYKGVVLRRASELPQPLPDGHFLRQFGQSDREIISDSSDEGTVPQLLTLFNGPVTHMMLEEGSLIHREVTSAEGIPNRVRIIFLSVLGRMPTSDDMGRAVREIRENDKIGYGDVIWALLNTREFLFIQ